MVVVKLGGDVDAGACLDDLAAHAAVGRRLVVVHGGGAEVDRLARELGRPPRHATSASGVRSRLTDAAALDVLAMALAGRVKPGLVAGLQRRGVTAAGLTGVDAGIVEARRKPALKVRRGDRVTVVREDLSGRIVRVRPEVPRLLVEAGVVPVLSPPGLGEAGPLNVDADRLAAAVAGALGASCLVFLTGAPGLLADPAAPHSLLPRLEPGEVETAGARGRMRHKALAAREALEAGVGRVVIGAGRGPAPLAAALAGRGTVVQRSPEEVSR
jgi:acetylglutamate/LysW-gamma-L-alpha-aminoadipate kinase